jgi:hypothetical protein
MLAYRHQALKGSDDRGAIEAVRATQHSLEFQHHRDRYKSGRAGVDQIGNAAGQLWLIAAEQPHQQIGVEGHGQRHSRKWVA